MALPVGPKRERQYRADRGQAVISTRPCERERPLFPVIASPSASEGEAIQNRAEPHGTPPAHDLRTGPPGLLRRLRRLAMTVDRAVPSPRAHDSRAGRAIHHGVMETARPARGP